MRKFLVVTFIAFSVLLLVVYSKSLNAPFVYDDVPMVKNNLYVKSQTNPLTLFSTYYHDSNFLLKGYRPLTLISLNLNSRILGGKPFVYRIVNIFLHVFNSLVLILVIFLVFDSMGEGGNKKIKYFCSLLGGILFLLHPLASQSINLVWKRSTLLVTFFYLSSIALFIFKSKLGKINLQINPSRTAALSIILLFILGLLCKEDMITLPIALLLLGLILKDENHGYAKEGLWSKRMLYVAILIIGTAYYIFRIIFLNGLVSPGYGIPTPSVQKYLWNQSTAVIQYINLFFSPSGLNIDHYIPDTGILLQKVFSLLLIIVFLTTGVAKLFFTKRFKVLGFCILFYFLTLVPSSSIFPLVVYMDEARAYLPMTGIIICLSYVTFTLMSARNSFYKSADIPLAYKLLLVLLISTLCFVTYVRNEDWRNPFSIWNDSLTKTPENPRALNGLANALRDMGMYNEAIKLFKKSILLDPTFYPSYNDLGITFLNNKDFKNGEFYLKKAEEMSPNYPLTLYNVAFLYESDGYFNPKEAIHNYKRIQSIWGDNLTVSYRLGLVYEKIGLWEMAMTELQKAERFLPSSSKDLRNQDINHIKFNIVYILGNLNRKKRNFRQAVYYYEKALEVIPWERNVMLNMAGVKAITGRMEEALNLYKEILSLYPQDKLALLNMGIIFEKTGRFKDAIKQYEEVLSMYPEDKDSMKALKRLKEY